MFRGKKRKLETEKSSIDSTPKYLLLLTFQGIFQKECNFRDGNAVNQQESCELQVTLGEEQISCCQAVTSWAGGSRAGAQHLPTSPG